MEMKGKGSCYQQLHKYIALSFNDQSWFSHKIKIETNKGCQKKKETNKGKKKKKV